MTRLITTTYTMNSGIVKTQDSFTTFSEILDLVKKDVTIEDTSYYFGFTPTTYMFHCHANYNRGDAFLILTKNDVLNLSSKQEEFYIKKATEIRDRAVYGYTEPYNATFHFSTNNVDYCNNTFTFDTNTPNSSTTIYTINGKPYYTW